MRPRLRPRPCPLHAALALAQEGLACFPCHPDKTPATPHGFKDATTDSTRLGELWRAYPGPLVGVATGAVSGIDVVDIDPRHKGDRWLAENKRRLPTTRVHITRSGGQHLLFSHTSGLRCSVGKIALGVDVRADGGYIIWWPAAGLSILSSANIASLPEWLCAPLQSSQRPQQRVAAIVLPDSQDDPITVHQLAGAVDGTINSGWINIRGPGNHSYRDRSLGFRFDPSEPYGLKIKSFAGDDIDVCHAHIVKLLHSVNSGKPINIEIDAEEGNDAKVHQRTARAIALWSDARSARGTIVETYLTSGDLHS